eukprot:4207757-Alexandrium_andersonii.AAC.1
MARSPALRLSCSLVGTARTMSTILSWTLSAGVGSPWADLKRDKLTTSDLPRDMRSGMSSSWDRRAKLARKMARA